MELYLSLPKPIQNKTLIYLYCLNSSCKKFIDKPNKVCEECNFKKVMKQLKYKTQEMFISLNENEDYNFSEKPG